MLNLPFPTDSLYKFSFMFGLFLIVFSIYYNDNQLNKYATNQTYHIRDSLIDELAINEQNIVFDNEHSLIYNFSPFSDHLAVAANKKDLMWNAIYYIEAIEEREKWSKVDYKLGNKIAALKIGFKDDLKLSVLKDSLNQLFNMIDIYRFITNSVEDTDKMIADKLKNKITLYNSKLSDYHRNFCFLITIGILLFISGTVLWYFQIQKPQDKLLKIQLAEAKKKVSITGRKHFEPKILPRPAVRNSV